MTPSPTSPPVFPGLRAGPPAKRLLRLGAAFGLVLLTGVASLGVGCTVDVIVGFGSCDYDGARFYSGDSFAAADGCNQCQCDGAQVVCTEIACGCVLVPPLADKGALEGDVLGFGATVVAPDGCNTCVCDPSGEFVCTTTPCAPCDGAPPPICVPPAPGCVDLGPLCGPTGWECATDCGGCDGPLPNCPAPPVGCAFSGPVCDGTAWSCGELYCDACSNAPPPCSDPGPPGCSAEPYCDGFAWYCVDVCQPQCDTPPQPCPYLGDGCDAIPVCGITGWECDSNCASAFDCLYPPPSCQSPDPYCTGQATCLDADWYCEFVCSQS